MPWSDSRIEEPAPQPAFNAPLAAVLLAASMPVFYLIQSSLPDYGLGLAFRPATLWEGGWWPGVVGAMVLHGGWAHVAVNAVMALAFGAPVARLLGSGRGVVAFLLFYMACGVLASIGYAAVHPDSHDVLVGASGAVSGLMGAAIRLIGRSSGRLRPLTDRRVLTMAAAMMALNALTGLIGLAPGMEGATIAWEAHAAGFAVGILTIGPLARALGRTGFDSNPDQSDPVG